MTESRQRADRQRADRGLTESIICTESKSRQERIYVHCTVYNVHRKETPLTFIWCYRFANTDIGFTMMDFL